MIINVIFPTTDNAVYAQWAVAILFWVLIIFLTKKQSKDIRLFILGLFIINLAWFAIRTLH